MQFDETADIQRVDQAEYRHFTGKQQIETAMNTLHGIVAGIVADSAINRKELTELTSWIGRHNHLLGRHPFKEVIPKLNGVIADGRIDEEEKFDLLWLCKQFSDQGTYYDEMTQHIQTLHGFLGGIVADTLINETELDELGKWMEQHEYLKSCWPFDELESIIAHVLRDGKVDGPEHEALLQFFSEFSFSSERQAIGALDREGTVSGVCAFAPELAFVRRYFCFTGSSKRSTRDEMVATIRRLGADWHNNLRNDTHYLVVGAAGNPCWAYACYGRKVEDAVRRRRDGQRLLIVHEYDFWDAVADHGGV